MTALPPFVSPAEKLLAILLTCCFGLLLHVGDFSVTRCGGAISGSLTVDYFSVVSSGGAVELCFNRFDRADL